MFYMGDEYGHTKGGNNNTYCHDSYVSTIWSHIVVLSNYLQIFAFIRHGSSVGQLFSLG